MKALTKLSEHGAVELLRFLAVGQQKIALANRFLELGVPGNKTEQYRHFGIKPLLERAYLRTEAEQGEPDVTAHTLTIKNGIVTAVPQEVDVSFCTDAETDMDHYDALYFLSHLLAPRYITVAVEDDCDITIVHQLDIQQTVLPYRIVIKSAPDCRAKVYETFENSGSSGSLLLYGLDVTIGKNGALTWIRNQTVNADDAVVIGSHRYDAGPQAELRLQSFDFGSGSAMHLYKNDLADHTETNVSHLLFAAGKAHRGNVVNLRHNGTYAKSLHRAKSIVKERATGIFDGRIRVGHDARYASAKQNAKAILLNDHAFMEAKPQLEIYTDELEASHGATTGQLDEGALFYLRSRGIGLDDARKMLILAFANEMIEEVEDPTVAAQIRDDFERAYYKG